MKPAGGETPADALLEWRREFPILERTVYLISNSLGAMPRAVFDSLGEYADTWARRGVRAWAEGWWEMPVGMGDLLAPILGSGAGEVSFHQNVTLAESVLLSCFDFEGSRRKIVLNDMEFPSLLYLYQAQKARGAEICVVPTDGITVDLDRFLEAIDEETLLVPVSHVLFRSSFIMDVEAVVRRAREVGAFVVLDVYQSAGSIPVDVNRLGVDAAVGGCLKWLCGGPGAAFLYIRPDLRRRLEPRLTGWMAHRDPFAFRTGEIELREDAFRFLNGTPHIPCLYAARPGLEIVGSIGVGRIREKSVRQVGRLIDLARQHGFPLTVPGSAEQRGGTVAINPPNALEIASELLARDILVDYRPGAGIRVSPHFYTSDAELEAVVLEMRSIIESGSWKRHTGVRTSVT